MNASQPKRPRILLLTRCFSPARAIAGVRTKSLARHLSRLGWRVTVVALDPELLVERESLERHALFVREEHLEVIYTHHRWRSLEKGFLKQTRLGRLRIFGGATRILAKHFGVGSGFGWVAPALRACRHLRAGDVDLVLASAPPYSAFVAGDRLSRRLECPLVMDYRDPWTAVPTYRRRKPHAKIVRSERRLLERCALALLVAPSLVMEFQRNFGTPSRKLCVLTNGFDADDLSKVERFDFGHFAVVYAGSFDPPMRTVTPILEMLRRIETRSSGHPVRFHYYGYQTIHVREEARRIGVEHLIVDHGRVSRAEALAAVKSAGVVVVTASVLDGSRYESRCIITGKVFEALGLRTPVLLVAPVGGDAAAIVEGAGAGRRFSAHETGPMADFVEAVRDKRWLQPNDGVGQFEWNRLAAGLDRKLRALVYGQTGAPRTKAP